MVNKKLVGNPPINSISIEIETHIKIFWVLHNRLYVSFLSSLSIIKVFWNVYTIINPSNRRNNLAIAKHKYGAILSLNSIHKWFFKYDAIILGTLRKNNGKMMLSIDNFLNNGSTNMNNSYLRLLEQNNMQLGYFLSDDKV